jgi:hypothetical protein
VDHARRLDTGRSDFFATTAFERNLNERLDAWLEPDASARAWLTTLRARLLPPSHGDVALVDHGARRSLRGLLASRLGHGVHTRLDAMLFHGG